MLKTNIERTKFKTMIDITYFINHAIPGIDGRYISPALISHANQSNEYYITLIESCIEIMSQHPVR